MSVERQDIEKIGHNGLPVDLFVSKVEAWSREVRTGYNGLMEFFKNNFLFVRDVYKNRLIPDIDRTRRSFIQLAVNQPVRVLFEKEVDSIEFDCEEAVRIYSTLGEPVLQSMRYPAGHHRINWRIKEFYIQVDTADTCNLYMWGFF